MDKIKVLITGPVNGSYHDLKAKLASLQKSKAGPFDMCFCTGAFFSSSSSEQTQEILKEGLVLPTYFCHVGILPSGITLPVPELAEQDDAEISIDDDDDDDDDEDKKEEDSEETKLKSRGIVKVGPNLFHLHGLLHDSAQTADVLNVYDTSEKTYLTVAFFPPNARMGTAQTSKLESKLKHPAYIGCDVLLTSEWGQGMASSSCVTQENQLKLKGGDSSFNLNEMGSFDVAELVSQCRPRYHFCPPAVNGSIEDEGVFFMQSLPYSNPASKMASGVIQKYHPSRFLALCPVVDPKTAKTVGKKKKFIHAVGLQPLWSMDRMTATAIPEGQTVVSNPYTDEAYGKDGASEQSSSQVGNLALSEAQARRIVSEESGGDQYRWNVSGRKRPLIDAANDPSNCTLFMHGLHRDMSGGANVNPSSIAQAFQPFGSVNVRFPTGRANSYCFIEFKSHDEAANCLVKTSGQIDIAGTMLTLKWGSGGTRGPPPPPPPGFVGIMPGQSKKQRRENLKEAEAADSCNLFVHLDVSYLTHEQCSRAIGCIQQFAQKILEDAINGDGTDGESKDSEEKRITAEDEPALNVTSTPSTTKTNYGFLHFASHAAASMALATLTSSTDGGFLQDTNVLESEKDLHDLIKGGIQVFWGKAEILSSSNTDGKDGPQLQKHHFPPDARTDCWFCLASPTCEKHLIVGVSDHCYVTMPKGPVNKHHTLIVPVTHAAGIFLDPPPGVEEEIEKTKIKLKKIANEELNKDLFVYERAIPTKGGYHSHINCVPINKGLTTKIYSAMMERASNCPGFAMKEIQNSDISLGTILKNSVDDDSEVCGYVFMEVGEKRFLYKFKSENHQKRIQIPIEFGREVLASVLEDPNLAQWKGCVLPRKEEEETCAEFRKLFEKYE